MAVYAIGDVQGCYDELRKLLKDIAFKKAADRLWFVGDLVNRGPKSLEVLRFVKDLEEKAVTVLGNHDLHLVTQHEGFERKRKDDTFDDILEAADAAELVAWLRTRLPASILDELGPPDGRPFLGALATAVARRAGRPVRPSVAGSATPSRRSTRAS